MTTIIPLANRARSHIALTRPVWGGFASGEREAQPLLYQQLMCQAIEYSVRLGTISVEPVCRQITQI